MDIFYNQYFTHQLEFQSHHFHPDKAQSHHKMEKDLDSHILFFIVMNCHSEFFQHLVFETPQLNKAIKHIKIQLYEVSCKELCSVIISLHS